MLLLIVSCTDTNEKQHLKPTGTLLESPKKYPATDEEKKEKLEVMCSFPPFSKVFFGCQSLDVCGERKKNAHLDERTSKKWREKQLQESCYNF